MWKTENKPGNIWWFTLMLVLFLGLWVTSCKHVETKPNNPEKLKRYDLP